jgi:flagellar protein FliL
MAENDASGSGSSAIILALVVTIITLAGGFGLTYYVLPQRLAEELVKAQKGGGEATGESSMAAAAHSGGSHSSATKSSVEKFEIQDLLVNVQGTRGTRFVKLSVFFEADRAVLTELDTKRPKITDIVSQTIGSKTMEELTSPETRGKIRGELIATINPLLEIKGEVKNVYFPEFIIQ